MHDIPELQDIQFLTVAEVAAVLRLSKMTVYRLIHSGDLEHARPGNTYRIPVAAVRRAAGMPPGEKQAPEG